MKISSKKLLVLSFVLVALSLPAFAQENMTYDPTYTGKKNEVAEQIRAAEKQSLSEKGFISPQSVQVSIVHHSYMDENQFGLQMSVPDMVSGCYEITPLEYEAKFVDPYYLDIKVKKYRRVAPEGAAAHKKCDRNNKMSSALMVLDKKDLQKRGTQSIRFSADAGSDIYKIQLDDQKIELVPESMVVFKGQGMAGELKDRLVYGFSNNRMVALHVPMANPGEDLTQQIMIFAANNALSPAGQPTWGGNGMATYYFYDQSGRTLSQIGENGYVEIGKVTANRPYDGAQGRVEAGKALSVFATRPGTQL